jgi:hypothetical protein
LVNNSFTASSCGYLCTDTVEANKGENGKPLPAVRKVYNRATLVHVAQKREVRDAWAIELRRIIGMPGEAEQRLAA